MNNENVISQYLREVKKGLRIDKALCGTVLGELKASVTEFCREKNDVSLEQLYAEFGTPEEISRSVIDREEYDTLLKRAKRKVLLWKVVAAFAVIAIAVFLAYTIKSLRSMGGTYTITNYDPEYYTSEGD